MEFTGKRWKPATARNRSISGQRKLIDSPPNIAEEGGENLYIRLLLAAFIYFLDNIPDRNVNTYRIEKQIFMC